VSTESRNGGAIGAGFDGDFVGDFPLMLELLLLSAFKRRYSPRSNRENEVDLGTIKET